MNPTDDTRLDHYRLPGNGNHPQSPRPLSAEDRAHGYLTLNLIGYWSYWVKRRVETWSLLSDSLAELRHSVDFRIRPWFPPPAVSTGSGRAYYYLPLTLLEKYDVPGLSLRDESGRALPLLTRRKSAAVATATLSALAKSLVLADLSESRKSGIPAGAGKPLGADRIEQITMPSKIERDLYEICHAAGTPDPAYGDIGAETLSAQFLNSIPDNATGRHVSQWPWERDVQSGPSNWTPNITEAEWRLFLASDERFQQMLNDFARFFLVLVPIEADENARRIVEISYRRMLATDGLVAIRDLTKHVPASVRTKTPPWVKTFAPATEDTLEQILLEPGNDWAAARSRVRSHDQPRRGLGILQKAAESVGWVPKFVRFDATSTGHGGSYHWEFEAPPGLQIRQATLTTSWPDGSRRRTQMGARSLQHAHLYLTDLPPNTAAEVMVLLKVGRTTLVRGAWFAALLSMLLLFFGYVKVDTLADPDAGSLGPTLAMFLLLPGLIAGLLSRGEEHPVTTNMLFGLRCLCGFVAALPISAAFFLLAFRSSDHFSSAWKMILAMSVWAWLVLSVTWWLAARRRPDGSAP